MSVLIRGMEMPKNCDDCFLADCYWACNSKSKHCPLVEIPPHGRLIDADFLLAEYDKIHVGKPGGARLLIANAPTIIPAEEGEG